MEKTGEIYKLIGKAMQKVGAIGKDSVNQQQKYKFRGIDAVYNALNPVMSELGLFVCPEILDHRREERESVNFFDGKEKKTILKYSILTIKYTMFAPDGSNVSCVVVGEGMDSGDKASNKAMSVALKYAMFQLLMIPTEEMVDPDSETHEVTSKAQTPTAPKQAAQERIAKPPQKQAAKVEVVQKIPQKPTNPVLDYLAQERANIMTARQISKEENAALWAKQVEVMKAEGLIPNKPLSTYTMQEAQEMVNRMYTDFKPDGTELLKDDGQTA